MINDIGKKAEEIKEWCRVKVMRDGEKACLECPLVYMSHGNCIRLGTGLFKCQVNNPFLWEGVEVLHCPENCKHMPVKESNQTDKKEDHFCTKYNTKIRHEFSHPKLNRCQECLKEGLEGF
jgi:hypothetical protein